MIMLSEYDLVTEIIDFYEHCSIAQSDYIIGILEKKRMDKTCSKEWLNLITAYFDEVFTPADCRFMFDLQKKLYFEVNNVH
jgi:hypothetical protein